MNQGVNAFDYSPTVNVIVTGGADGVLRVWHLGMLGGEPTVKLVDHSSRIVDLVINDVDQHIIGLSASNVIRVWDLQSFGLIQVKTPCSYSRDHLHCVR